MVKLEDYQLEALYRMHNGCILNGGTGSGKSITALAYYFIRQGGSIDPWRFPKKGQLKDLYIITTAFKRDTGEWNDELLHYAFGVGSNPKMFGNKIRIDSWNNISKYVGVKDAFFIFDEQRAVNYGTWSKSLIAIAKNNDWIMLSATPGDNYLDYMPVFIANGFYRNKTEFIMHHVCFSRYSKYKIERYYDIPRLERLKAKVLVQMEAPKHVEKIIENIIINYDIPKYRDLLRNRFNYEKGEPIENIAELCSELRKVANKSGEKLEALDNILAKHQKVILFYNFDYELEELRWYLTEIGYPFSERNGHKHEGLLDGDRWVYLVQYNAGAEAWNCISTNAMVFFSLNYSYKMMTQAAGRIDRMNTPFDVLYYYYIYSRAPIDMAINKALKEKKKFNENHYFRNFSFGREKIQSYNEKGEPSAA